MNLSRSEFISSLEKACVQWNIVEFPGYSNDFPRFLAEEFCNEYFEIVNPESYIPDWMARQIENIGIVRFGQARINLMPWLTNVVDLSDKKVIQIGAGTGPVTLPLVQAAKRVTAIEISEKDLKLNKLRLEMFGCIANYSVFSPSWIHETDWSFLKSQDPIVVVLYAVFEHLTPIERVAILRAFDATLKPGDYFVMFETPNRLHPVDWHGTQMLFPWVLPEELASAYLSAHRGPDRNALLKRARHAPLPAFDPVGIYRAGFGASFHEFILALDLDDYEIVADEHSSPVQNWYNPDGLYEEALASALERSEFKIAKGFARPSLDFVFRKK